MRILLYHWKAYSDFYLEKKLRALGNEVKAYADEDIVRDDDKALPGVLEELGKGYDMAVSYNYFPIVAAGCNTCGIPYVSWMQDAPLMSLYDSSAGLATNYFFCFDSEQYLGMKQRGIENVWYFPLAVDSEALYYVATHGSKEEKEKYSADVSFVGSLYSEKNMFGAMKQRFPEYVQGYLDGVLRTQLLVPSVRYSGMQIADNVKKLLQDTVHFNRKAGQETSDRELFDNLLDGQVTTLERAEMVALLAELDSFKLYTDSDTSAYPGVQNMGTVDYYTQMPKVFYHSKININVSSRTIRGGIPLRVLDVIACGGFCLTNAQPDLYFYFEEGKSIVTFQNQGDMRSKIAYYLEHDKERQQIIEEGRKVIREQFDFDVLLPHLLEKVGL